MVRARVTRTRLLGFLAIYLLLVGVSHLVRWSRQSEFTIAPGEHAVAVRAVEGGRRGPQTLRLVYKEYGAVSGTRSLPIILLHGSPGTSRDFDALGPALAGSHRAMAPDLPGFGRSSRKIPDYSFRAHADYVLQLMDRLNFSRAHIVSFSMGGGVALSLIDLSPGRVASLTMLSSIGVQEMELLGEYHINHAIHGAQLGALWLLTEFTPQMGLLDASMLNLPYARNFYDSDQRPLRAVLEGVSVPTLIIHGRQDELVPFQAALEHERLVPQSELHPLDTNHFVAFRDGPMLAGLIGDFADRVERGAARRREQADPARIRAAEAPFDPATIPRASGLTALVFVVLLALATLVSEDLTCIAAGVMVAEGRISFLVAVIGCTVGIWMGDMLLFLAGRFLGRAVVTMIPFRWIIRRDALEQSSEWLRRRGAIVVLVSRFVPGTRLATYVAAGLLDTSFWLFIGYFGLAVVLWTPLVVGISAIVGHSMLDAAIAGGQGILLRAAAAAALAVFAFRLLVRAATFRGRRLLLSRWCRLTRWEFWPPWAFYPPVVAYLGYLMVKHRSVTLFTAANPAILAGGFVGESKIDILRGLGAAGDRVARATLLEGNWTAHQKIVGARRFMEENRLALPVVLKPNHGQRGSGVVVVKSDDDLQEYLARSSVDTIIQEYAPGSEFGVFYWRYPSEEHGRIFSVTEKRFPFVTGDGRRTLEELILGDDRAVCMARFYLNRQRRRLLEVPEAGERIDLVDLGTHCRGAMFVDGGWVVTPAIASVFDEISLGFEGFYFGRFDVRTPSVEDFRSGQNFRIIELNGVTSEATHIYDPDNSIWKAYRILFDQWRAAFEIGAENRARGVEPVPLRMLVRLLREYNKTARLHLVERVDAVG